MASHNDFGNWAENIATEYLEGKEYRIIERNFRYLKAEIDIIAIKDNVLIIVEVKARKNAYFNEPQEAVHSKKRALLIKAAEAYMEQNNLDIEIRFDIISILSHNENNIKIEHIENAFDSIH